PIGPFRGTRHTLLPQEADRGFHVAVGLLQRALAVHHRRAGLIAKLFDQGGRDLSHPCAPPPRPAPPQARPARSRLPARFLPRPAGTVPQQDYRSSPPERTPS